MSTFKFRLPNLHQKFYVAFEEKLNTVFGKALKELDPAYQLEIENTADTYGIRVRKIALPVMYTVICSASKIEVTINPNARKEIRPEITDLLFNFIVDYLEI
ncbi:MAG: hypothetical protein V4520_12055 [Bacteroidota bacterium]